MLTQCGGDNHGFRIERMMINVMYVWDICVSDSLCFVYVAGRIFLSCYLFYKPSTLIM